MCSDNVQVVREERDLILARGLFEVGEYSGKWPVVGVVGAAHVKGIQEQWSFACTPEAAQQVAGLMEAPSPELAGSFASKAIAGISDDRCDAFSHHTDNMANGVE